MGVKPRLCFARSDAQIRLSDAFGDKTVQMPMFAQIYTYAPDTDAEVIVEAPVTLNTCGLDLMGDTISSLGGIVAQDEITVAMPDCSAVGEFVQLIGLAPDRKLALAN